MGMKSILLNIFWTAVFWCGLCIVALMIRSVM